MKKPESKIKTTKAKTVKRQFERLVMCKQGDEVLYKSRKWIVANVIGDKAFIVLAPSQKAIWRGIKTINFITTKIANLTACT